jgi:hypothetical protein
MIAHPRRAAPLAATLLLCLAAALPAAAQEPFTAHTLRLVEGQPRPAAAVGDVAWIAGHWRGEGLGGVVEEVWAPPLGGTMMGMFRLVRGDEVSFYEIMTIAPDGESLTLSIKHFHADLRGWEERDESVAFPLVRLDADVAWFSGLTIRREGGDALRIHVALGQADGPAREAEFLYHRVGGAARPPSSSTP